MNNEITSRQTACICCLSFLALKLVALPSVISRLISSSAIIVTIIMFCIELVMLYIFITANEKYPKMSLFEIMSKIVGKVIAKIIYILFAFIFVCKLSLLLNEGFVYMKNIVDEDFRIILFLFTFLPVVTSMAYSGLRSTARTCEFGFVFIIVGLISSLFLAKLDIEFGEIGSIFSNSFISILKTCFDSSFWFTDFLFILILGDKIKQQKNMKKNIMLFVFVIEIVIAIFYLVYFRLFKQTGYIHETAIADITQYKKNIGNVGNVDIIETLVYLFTIFLYGAIYFTCLCNIFVKVTNDRNIFHSLIFANLLVIIIQYFVFYNLEMFTSFATQYLKYSTILVWGIVPAFYILLFIFDRGKYAKKNKNNISKSKT